MTQAPGAPAGQAVAWPIALAAAGLLLAVVIRAAWLCDDAYITLRTVDNFVNGLGLRWNAIERVQTFTHPAWVLLISPFYAMTGEAYFTVITLQLALAALTFCLCFRLLASSVGAVVLAVAALASSRAFVDFSTSGLENGLAHLLIVTVLVVWLRDRARPAGLAGLGLAAAGLVLCRLDLVALIAPLLAMALWPIRRARLVSFAVGFAPFLAWELFSLIYYGQLVPNTALAKLPPGVPTGDLAAQGLRYLAATWHFDSVTVLVVLASVALLTSVGGAIGRAIAAGIVLHVLSVVLVGGDFMSGRFLTPAFLAGVAGIISIRGVQPSRTVWIAAAAVLVIIGAFEPGTALRTTADFRPAEAPGTEFARHGVTDERRFYYPALGLLPVLQGRASPAQHGWAAAGLEIRSAAGPERRVRPASNVGLFGYYAGPDVYVIDRYALTDPFLARLPPRPGWRVGHYERAVPPEYEASRRADRNLFADPALYQLYDHIERLSRADIWSGERFALILRSLW